MAPRLETVPHQPDPLQVLALASRRTSGLAMLHSAAIHPSWGRWSILCAEPVRIMEVSDTSGLDPFTHLAEQIHKPLPSPVAGADLPFWAGWVGYMGYEAGRFLETLPARTLQDVRLPMARFGLYGSAALYDHITRRWTVTAADLPDHPNTPLTGDDGLRFWTDLLRDAERETLPASATAPTPLASIGKVDEYLAGMQASLSPEQFKAAVARAVDYIAAGDIYQVNLARRLSTALPADPLDLYLRLCRANPAWYAAYLAFDDKAVLSSSPELFLQVRGDHVITRPIKGTSPRVHQDDLDARARRDLLASEKDHAELAMIIDLMRNDLGRVCRFGSVRVLEPFGLEEHPTVYHLVGTIEGRLVPGRDAIDLLRATFPGGSITGAPKIRAMQIVDELEPVTRSVYCGAIGCISLDGAMTMNIAIRTLLVDGPRVHLYAGGGIVADSRPDLELHETTAKARGMARALASFL
jgi:para-aminobenzoate synthetase component 1